MKFSLSWLKEHLDTEASADEIADALTALGLEVEGVSDVAAVLAPFKVAYVVEAAPHPNADRLRVCTVDTADGRVQVVCGAPNARTGMKGVFAPVGLTIPGTGLLLKPSQIRGVESQGMLVSEREMGLSDEHDGIIEMPADAPIGKPFAEILGLNDPVIDIAITPNRGDCFAVRGVARDLAAKRMGRLKPKPVEAIPGRFDSPIGVEIEDPAACPMFAGRMIRGVSNGPSPDWLQRRLKSVGLRPISALVDVTNFLTLDRARPLHVFDAAKLKGGLHARRARPGETLEALDGKTYTLDPEICVIADDGGTVGLGGVMGGMASGCTEATHDVFIECALFDPIRTAQTGRKLGIVSDARQRFERGVDPEFVRPGLELATAMILDLCGGAPSAVITRGAPPKISRRLELRSGRLRKLAGIALGEEEAAEILRALGAEVSLRGGTLVVETPSWRPDLSGEADLIEEIVRVKGLEHIPATPLPQPEHLKPALSGRQSRVRIARRALAARGLLETVSYSFISGAEARLFGQEIPSLRVVNPIAADLDVMRPNLLASLIAAARRNALRAQDDIALFEIAPQYAGTRPEDQSMVAAGLRRGFYQPRQWAGQAREADVFDVKADAMALLDALKAPLSSAQIAAEAPHWYHPGRSGTIRLGPKTVLASFGELHPELLGALDLKGRAVAFEIHLDRIPEPKSRSRTRPPLEMSALLPVNRDFAFIVDEAVGADAVIRAARGADKALIADVRIFDLFTGEGVGPGKKSLALTVRLQPRDKTLTEAEIDAVADRIVGAVAKATGGSLRSG